VARILLSTDCIVTEKPKKKEDKESHPGMDQMDDMGY
jgi:hypothetical protein